MIWPQGREGENPQFVQSNCDHQSTLFRLTDQRRIWITEEIVAGIHPIQLPSVTFTVALDAFDEV